MLTDAVVKKAGRRDRDYKIADAGGLYLFVSTTGRKTWRVKYRIDGKEKRLVIGAYPDVTLKLARAARDDARKELGAGRDPQAEKRRERGVARANRSDTFEKYARMWHAKQCPRWRDVHASDVLVSLERDLFPAIGSTPIAEIDKPRMLAAISAVEKRGAIESAQRLRQRASRIFAFAAANGAENSNPAHGIIDALSAMPAKKRWPAIVDIDRLRLFMKDVDATGSSPVTRLASRFTALTAQRPAMIRRLPWVEIEGVDWNAPEGASPAALWRVPPHRMKLEHDETGDEAFEHVIPLAPQAIETLMAIRRLTGDGPMVFPSIRSAGDPISENAIGYLYNRIGYKGVHVPHGWRSSFSTIMNQRTEREHVGSDRLNIDRVIIDLMLAHVPIGMSATEWRYNRARYMERRREIACDWANLLLHDAAAAMSLMEGRRRPTDR